jgi:hypothetical protein
LASFCSLGIGRHYSIVRFFIQYNFLLGVTFGLACLQKPV